MSNELPQISYRELTHILARVGIEKSEWAGMPVPIEGCTLVLEKNHPYKQLETFFASKHPEDPDGANYEVLNHWFSYRLRGDIYILRDKRTGKSVQALWPDNQGQKLISTLGASFAWPLEAERKAIDKLATMIRHHLFVAYLTTGAFIETSPRSKITYIFRKMRPTIAFKADNEGSKMLCSLCLHPIGYYEGSWAGCMVPTDDVVAHLTMMRGDEHYFWRCANQHPVTHPAAGL